jgi:hypothetical protein
VSAPKLPVETSHSALDLSARAPDHQIDDLMSMVALLSPRDLAALAGIVRRTAEISETEGEDMAIAVIDQIHAILNGRKMDA